MNSLYTLALRQSSSLESDLSSLSHLYSSPSTSHPASTSALHGQINASLAAFDRTIEDYDSMAKREIVEVKKEKALQRVARFKEDYISLRKQYERIKTEGTSTRVTSERNELFTPTASTSTASSHSYSASSSSTPLNRSSRPPISDTTTINFGGSSSNTPSHSAYGNGGGDYSSSIYNNPRTNHALKEHDFFSSTSSTLDAYLAQGQAVLGNLATQREVMKGTKKRLLNAANTLGLSRETIQFIERRTKGDWWILVGGGTMTIVCFVLILKYFG
ncbi:Bos1p [Sporobolomyces salmoneus]|uniref:Bos1p n=1 Tax=Sporobolomyces salmoneus TaxID=183962 RepID=UPI003179F267